MTFTGEHLLRELAPQVLGAVVRRFRDFAARRITDAIRADLARRRRETEVAAEALESELVAQAPDSAEAEEQQIKTSGIGFAMPSEAERAARLDAVLHVLYLIFSEGYVTSGGPALQRRDLANEAIRLGRMLHRTLPDDGEATGVLALMLLTDARRHARSDADGELIPLDKQDRTLWDRTAIEEGTALITRALSHGAVGPYQLQAAIAALHDAAAVPRDTDWPQILALYGLLLRMSDNPVVRLNHAVATAMVQGPQAGLDLLERLAADERMAGNHRVDAARAHLLEKAGEPGRAVAHYLAAAR